MNTEEKKSYLLRVFNLARTKGICKTQKDFAELLALNPTTLSNALQGREGYVTDNLIRRVQVWAAQQHLEEKEQQPAPVPAPKLEDVVIPGATAALYNNMSETIRIQAELIARLQGGLPAGYPSAFMPKGSTADGWHK